MDKCIMLAGPGRCNGLAEMHPACGSKGCPFYKTEKQERESQHRCRVRALSHGAFEVRFMYLREDGKCRK